MNIQDYDQFCQAMTATMELYNKPSLSEFSLSLWWGALNCYTLSEVLGGLSRHVQNPDSGQFAPKPADVVRAIGGTTHDNSAMAWAKVDRAVRSIGGYEDVVFDDAYIHAAIEDMGGWVRVCTVTRMRIGRLFSANLKIAIVAMLPAEVCTTTHVCWWVLLMQTITKRR